MRKINDLKFKTNIVGEFFTFSLLCQANKIKTSIKKIGIHKKDR